MAKFKVQIDQTRLSYLVIEIEGDNEDDALDKLQERLDDAELDDDPGWKFFEREFNAYVIGRDEEE